MNIPCWARDNSTLARLGDLRKPMDPNNSLSSKSVSLRTSEIKTTFASSPYCRSKKSMVSDGFFWNSDESLVVLSSREKEGKCYLAVENGADRDVIASCTLDLLNICP